MELDFSGFRKEGQYRIRYGDALSEPFSIGPDVWDEPLWNVLNFYFCQRCGYPVEGIHDVCHADSQASWDGRTIIVNGGWHDAGDLSQGFWRTACGCYALLGALPVGVDSFRDDAPFWNGTAHATAHEIWIEPVSRFLGTLSVYLKHNLYEP